MDCNHIEKRIENDMGQRPPLQETGRQLGRTVHRPTGTGLAKHCHPCHSPEVQVRYMVDLLWGLCFLSAPGRGGEGGGRV